MEEKKLDSKDTEENGTEDSGREKLSAEEIGMNRLEQVSGGTDPLADIPKVKLYPYDDDIRKKV